MLLVLYDFMCYNFVNWVYIKLNYGQTSKGDKV